MNLTAVFILAGAVALVAVIFAGWCCFRSAAREDERNGEK